MFSIPRATQPRFSSPRHAPGCSRALLLVPRGDLGDSLDSAGVFQGCPKTLSRRSWDGLGALLGANFVPRWLHRTPNDQPRSTLDRFCDRFSLFFDSVADAVALQNRSTCALEIGDHLGRIAQAASLRPHRPGRIALAASPWPHRLGHIAPRPYCPGRIGIELPCERARYRASLPRSAHHRARSIWPIDELASRNLQRSPCIVWAMPRL